MVQVTCIARTPEFVQLIEDLIVILLGTNRNFRWSAHRRSIVLPYRSRATYSPKSHNAAGISGRYQPVAGFVRWSLNLWCPGAELNHRHLHFQCSALPTELPGRRARAGRRTKERGGYRGSIPGCPERPCALAIRAQDASSPRFAADAPSSSSSSLTGTA